MNFLNSQKYSDCQLVSAINAAKQVHGDFELPDFIYEQLVDISKCRYGGALRINEAIKFIGLRARKFHNISLKNIKKIKEKHPVSLGIFTKEHGLHSVFIEKIEGSKLKVWNWKNHDWVDFYSIEKDIYDGVRYESNIGI